MPDPRRSSDGRFNPPAVIAARLLFVLQLFGWIIGAVFVVLALGEASGARALQAGLAFALSYVGREWLRRTGKLDECAESFDTMFTEAGVDDLRRRDDPAADRLAILIERRTWLETHRGAPGFDPWELQQVRHDITDHMKKNPALARSVRDEVLGR